MINLIEDISKLTTIPEKVLTKLVEKVYFCVSNAVEEAVLAQEKVLEIDTGVGILLIKLNSDNVRYKFIPNKELETSIKNTILNKKNLLQDTLETTLVTRIINTYKELI